MTLTATIPSPPPLASPDEWPTLRALPSEVAQRIFRACLAALSRPGTVQRLPDGCVPEPVPAVVAPMLALTDLMAPVSGLDTAEVPGARRAAELIGWVTGARVTDPGDARYAVAFAESDQMAELSVGSAWSPELGTMLCQRVAGLHEGPGGPDTAASQGQPALALRLRGPGIATSSELTIHALSSRFVERRAELTADFPAGVDILLVTDAGTVAGLPRTTRIEVW